MVGTMDWCKIAKASTATLLVLLLTFSPIATNRALAAFGKKRTDKEATPATKVSGKLTEVAPPAAIQELRQAFDDNKPQVSILNPRPNEVLSDDTVSIQFQVKDLPLFKDNNLGLGPHLHVFLDNQPYQAVYDSSKPLVLEKLSPGTHTIRAFASRPWHESFKNEGAYAQTTFHIYTKTGDNSPDSNLPLLTYSRPQASYGAEPIMLDFYLTNAPLHLVAREDKKDDIPDWRIRCTINGDSFVLDQWQPIYLKGFKPGKNWVQLEFLDENGNSIKNVFNNTVRVINYEPGGKDTLSKLVRGDLNATDTRGIVDANYKPPAPTPSSSPAASPIAKPTPTPVPVPVPVAPKVKAKPTPTPSISPVPLVKPSPESSPIPSPKPVESPTAIESPKPEATPTPKAIAPTPKPTPKPEAKVETKPAKSPAKDFFNRLRGEPKTEQPKPVPSVTPSANPLPKPTPSPSPVAIPKPVEIVPKTDAVERPKPVELPKAVTPLPVKSEPVPSPKATTTPTVIPTPVSPKSTVSPVEPQPVVKPSPIAKDVQTQVTEKADQLKNKVTSQFDKLRDRFRQATTPKPSPSPQSKPVVIPEAKPTPTPSAMPKPVVETPTARSPISTPAASPRPEVKTEPPKPEPEKPLTPAEQYYNRIRTGGSGE
uniref:FHA domain containing protein n=1 Tax=Oscillatoriales cyanobacterium SpSt-402 TaxID=2282168 RepID=A0A832M6G5_9CYAN